MTLKTQPRRPLLAWLKHLVAELAHDAAEKEDSAERAAAVQELREFTAPDLRRTALLVAAERLAPAEALQVARSNDSAAVRSEMLSKIAARLTGKDASAVAQEALHVARSIDRPADRGRALAAAASVLPAEQRLAALHEAFQAVALVADSAERCDALADVCAGLTGEEEDAFAGRVEAMLAVPVASPAPAPAASLAGESLLASLTSLVGSLTRSARGFAHDLASTVGVFDLPPSLGFEFADEERPSVSLAFEDRRFVGSFDPPTATFTIGFADDGEPQRARVLDVHFTQPIDHEAPIGDLSAVRDLLLEACEIGEDRLPARIEKLIDARLKLTQSYLATPPGVADLIASLDDQIQALFPGLPAGEATRLRTRWETECRLRRFILLPAGTAEGDLRCAAWRERLASVNRVQVSVREDLNDDDAQSLIASVRECSPLMQETWLNWATDPAARGRLSRSLTELVRDAARRGF